MKEHFSVGGTTCWFCGWPAGYGQRVRKLVDEVLYLACRDCHHTPTGEEVSRRAADVAGLAARLRGEAYQAQYWTQGQFELMVREWSGQNPQWLERLLAKPYEDSFAGDTHARQAAERKEYAKSYNKGRSTQLRDQYAKGGGRERAAERYQERKAERKRLYEEGGGKERAAAAYVARKALQPPKEPKAVKPLPTYDPVKARAYAKEYYQRRKLAAIEERIKLLAEEVKK